jgi:2-polyprenyl-3-methyl-5-hydroxy-6-metoxy-1,4-benzoquinol methylase
MPEGEIFTASDYREVYPAGIERHFWNIARNDLVYRWLKPHLAAGDQVMDVGCGTGIVVGDLLSRRVDIRGVEMGAAPVMPGLESRVKTGTDLFDLEPATRNGVNAVLLLDVIEHIAERRDFMQRIHRDLPNCRVVLLTVPARRELWSGYDEHWGHHLRYDRPTLLAELEGCGFRPIRTAYFFHWLYLASLATKVLRIPRGNEFQPIPADGLKAALHRFIGSVTRLESRLVPGCLPGSSIACLAVRAPLRGQDSAG